MGTDWTGGFGDWLDRVCEEQPGDAIVAFSINLYDEPFKAEVVGSTYYDPDDPDWACEEAFEPEERTYELPEGQFAESWEARLEAMVTAVGEYLGSQRSGATRLRQAKAVTVGFVDGDLVPVWPKDS